MSKVHRIYVTEGPVNGGFYGFWIYWMSDYFPNRPPEKQFIRDEQSGRQYTQNIERFFPCEINGSISKKSLDELKEKQRKVMKYREEQSRLLAELDSEFPLE